MLSKVPQRKCPVCGVRTISVEQILYPAKQRCSNCEAIIGSKRLAGVIAALVGAALVIAVNTYVIRHTHLRLSYAFPVTLGVAAFFFGLLVPLEQKVDR